MNFRRQNDRATKTIREQLGGKVIPFSQLFSVWSEGRLPRLTENLLILGNRVRRVHAGRVTEELQVQIEWDDRAGYDLVQRVVQMSEEDPLGIVDQAAIQQILGGSDPAQVEIQDREGRKIRSLEDGSRWSLEWIGYLPRNTSGLHELLRELGAFSLTEQRAVREAAKKHREHNAGAFFPYCLYPVTDCVEQWKIGKSKEEIDALETMIEEHKGLLVEPWKEWYRQWVSCCWEQLVHFGVPGVQEMMYEQFRWFGFRFNWFDPVTFFFNTWFPWFKTKAEEDKDFLRDDEDAADPEFAVGKYWIPTPHCAITALEENVEHQATEAAKGVLKKAIRTLLTNDHFVKRERVSFSALARVFKDWPYVLETRRWYQDRTKPRWVIDKLPKKKWQENSSKPDCVHIKIGLWANDHYFYWREDVNHDFNTDLWPDEVRNTMTVACFDKGGRQFPSLSSGRMMQKLIEGGFLKPLAGMSEVYAGVCDFVEKDPQKLMMNEFDRLSKEPTLLRDCCVVDTEYKLMSKLGTGKVNRFRLFAADTEAFIDPITGKHNTSMLIIKKIFDDPERADDRYYVWNIQKYYSWNMKPGTDVVHKGMTNFMKYYMHEVAAELSKDKNRPKNVSDENWKKFKDFELETCFFPTLWYIKDCMKQCGIKQKDTLLGEIGKPIIYFHNLGYDVQPFLCAFAPNKKETVIKKGAIWYRASFKCKYGEFELRNSLTIITTALRNFPKMFLPKDEQKKMVKEVYAYNAINQAMVEEKIPGKSFIISLEKFKEYIELFEFLNDPSKQEKLYEDIVATASRPEVNCIEDGMFDVGKYAEYYCERDVDLLCLGLRCWAAIGEQDTSKNTFKGIPPFEKFDVFNFLSAPAIAQAVTEAVVRKGVPQDLLLLSKKEKGVSFEPKQFTFKYKGLLRKFMLHATTGGRCTLANEKRICENVLMKNTRVKEIYEKVVRRQEKPTEEELKEMFRLTIQDFDARSLYPTAMSRSFIPLGMPVLVDWRNNPKTQEHIIAEANDKKAPTDAMYLITNIQYGVPLAMPSNCWKQEKPEPRCRWTNDVPPDVIQLRKLTDLYTMIETQNASFKILGGLEWRHGKTEAIQDFMKKTYEFRRLNHSGGFDHPIQEAAKLIMNSFYGKNVTKMREFNEIFFPKVLWKHDEKTGKFYQVNGADNLMNYLKNNWRDIKQVISVGGSFAVKVKAEDESAYDVNFGCEVLAGARALICRVSAAIEKITKQPPLYTDTDSLHVYGWQIEAIADWFEKKFNIPMIGGELGQFHPDFEPQGFKPGEKFMGSIFFCGVGKKMYIDEIIGDQGSTYFHKRAKGIKAEWLSKEEYVDLFNGEVIEKDCDKLGGVNIRARDGSNFTVRLIKKIKATAGDEVEVDDEIRTLSNEQLREIGDGNVDFACPYTPIIDEAEFVQNSACTVNDNYLLANKRARENNPPEEDNDTVLMEEIENEILDENTQPTKIIKIL